MKMKYFAFLIILITLFSCSSECIRGSGNLITDVRDVNDYNALTFTNSLDLVIGGVMSDKVVIEGESNIVEFVDLEVLNNLLEVKVSGECIKRTRPITLFVGKDNLSSFTKLGTGETSGRLSATSCEITNFGTGDIVLVPTGVVDIVLDNSGSADIVLDERSVNSSTITSSSTGDIYIWATDDLTVTLSGTGDVYYKGNPTIISTISGTGDLIDNN